MIPKSAFNLFISFALALGFTLSPALSMDTPMETPQEKTFIIRDEIMNFYTSNEAQERINENSDLMWQHNIDDINAYFSEIVANPNGFSLLLNQQMKQSEPEEEQPLRSSLQDIKFIPLLYRKDTPLLHDYVQKLYKKAGNIIEPLILLSLEPIFNNPPCQPGSFDQGYPFIIWISYKDIATMSDQSIKGCLAHEMGHIKCQHYNKTKTFNTLSQKELRVRAFNREYNADRSACIDFDEGVDLLCFLKEKLPQDEEIQALINPRYSNNEQILPRAKREILKELKRRGIALDPKDYQAIVNCTDEEFLIGLLQEINFTHPPVWMRIARLECEIKNHKNHQE